MLTKIVVEGSKLYLVKPNGKKSKVSAQKVMNIVREFERKGFVVEADPMLIRELRDEASSEYWNRTIIEMAIVGTIIVIETIISAHLTEIETA